MQRQERSEEYMMADASDTGKGPNRPRYFDGQLLKAEDLRLEQVFLDDRMRLHNRFLHGCGIVHGLDVQLKEDADYSDQSSSSVQVVVSPGYALSPQGDEIIVPTEQLVTVPCHQSSASDCFDEEFTSASKVSRCYLAVRYDEKLCQPAPAMPADCQKIDSLEYARVCTGFSIACLDYLPDGCCHYSNGSNECCSPEYTHRVEIESAPDKQFPPFDVIDDPWVPLAVIERSDEGDTCIDYSVRCRLYPRRIADCLCSKRESDSKKQLRSKGRIATGMTALEDWQQYGGDAKTGIFVDVDTSSIGFSRTPVYVAVLAGDSRHWSTTGGSSIYDASPTGFRMYIRWVNGDALTPTDAKKMGWRILWLGMEA